MKWLLFFLSLLALFVANSTLFWLPGRYDWFTFLAAPISISVAIFFAWSSSKRFVASSSAAHPTWKNVMMAPPSAICIFVLLLFMAVGLLKLIAYGHW